ncbi:MAG TPA: S8 family serine peptidase [Mycobacteriales bacterium]|nr:S8 family serine peptidase [Mycobacteriales bacterium]
MRRRLVATLGATALVVGIPAAYATDAAQSRARVATAPPAAPGLHESNRPKSCPQTPKDPDTGDHEKVSPLGTFPWPKRPHGVNPTDYLAYDHTKHTRIPTRPANWANGGSPWKLSSTRVGDKTVRDNPQELCGVEGNSVDKAWETTTGRPSTVIAITDSGIEWCQASTADKIYINRADLPPPRDAAGHTKAWLEAHGHRFADSDLYDLNDDGVFNVADYAHDPRVAKPYFCGSFVSPKDLIRTFGTKGGRYYYGNHPQSPAGFTEAIAGWNFLDNTNDPYDDVHYDHGSGEAEDSTGAANALGSEPGSCPNCMVMPIRVGESFIAASDNFAQGVMFAVDSGASVVQEALGSYDITSVTQQAIHYAMAHGVPIIASAADEEAEHHNLPGYLPHTIVVNSVTQSDGEDGVPLQVPDTYLHLNGCTNYGANIAVSVESGSCSSEATGKTGGIAGLAESAARDAVQRHRMRDYPGLRTVAGAKVPLSVNEVQQLITMTADDVDFQTAAPPYGPPDNYLDVSPYPTVRYKTQPGFDMYTGYGRIDAASIMRRISTGDIPPEASLDGQWFQTFTTHQTITVRGLTAAVRAKSYHWALEAGVGTQPEPGAWHTVAAGHGPGGATGRRHGVLARVSTARLAALFPNGTSFTGGPTTADGRPDPDRFSVTLRLVVVDNKGRVAMDRRTDYLHDDPALLPGFPKHYGASVDSSPTLAPIGPHYTDALIVATTDGVVHAYRTDGKELPGWPVHTDAIPVHRGEPAYRSGAVTDIPHGSIVGAVAVGDLADATGRHPDVVVSDFTGHVYAWNAKGKLLHGFPRAVHPAYGGPAARDEHNRLQRAFLGGPALAPLMGGKRLDVVAAAMDRHVYAWQPNGKPVPGWPKLLIDRSEISHVARRTNKITFKASSRVDQGSPLVDTPAIGVLSGKGAPDVVVGADEEYDGSPNVSVASPDVYALGAVPLLNAGNSRVYALSAKGKVLPGWPASIEDLDDGLLPDVGDGTTGSPALADVNGDGALEVGVSTSVGPPYVLTATGKSALGTGPDGKAIVGSATLGGAGNGTQLPTIAVEGMPIFAPLGPGAPGISLIDPAATLGKALDAAVSDSQLLNNNDIGAWNATTGLMQPAFPQVMNDLQFIVSPVVADVGGASGGPYLVDGSASYDVRAVNGLGQEAPGFPKFDGGWMVNSPSFGRFGNLAHQVLAVGTREGNLYVWTTPTPSCASSGPWPREHHDLSNTSNLDAPAGLPPARCRH